MHVRNIRSLALRGTAAALVGLLASCSRQARSVRHLTAAEREYTAGRFDQAEIEFKNVIQLDPANAVAISRLGLIYQEEGRTAKALPYLAKAKELRPDDLAVRYHFGVALLSSGDANDARTEALYVLDHRAEDGEAALLLAEAALRPTEVEAARQRLNQLPPAIRARASSLVALGELELRAQRPGEAEKLFRQALQADAKSANASAAVGMLLWARHDLAGAAAALKLAADASPPRSPRRLQYAQFKVQTGDVAAARQLLEEISRQAPDYLPAWTWQAEIAATDKKFDAAQALLAKAAARDPVAPEVLLLSARIHSVKGESDAAIADLQRMLAAYPRSALAHYQLGLVYGTKGETSKAVESLKVALECDPTLTPATVALGQQYVRRGDFDSAIVLLKPAAQRSDMPGARLLLAEAHRRKGNLDDALALYSELDRQFPGNAQTLFLTGLVLRQQNQRDAARGAFTKARDADATMAAALEQLIEMDLEDKNFAAARQRAESAAVQMPTAVEPLLLLAKVYATNGEKANVAPTLERAIALRPDSPAAYLLLARWYVSSGETAKALEHLSGLLAKNPQQLDALAMTAVLRDVQQDFPAARDAYEALLKADSNSVIALNNLAYLYAEKFAQLDRAFDLAQRARARAPQDPRAADTLGWILYRRGAYATALPLLQESAAQLRTEPEVQFHLAMTYYRLGQETAARALLEATLQTSATFTGADEARRRVAILATDPATVTADQQRLLSAAITERPADPIAALRLSRWHQSHGELAKATELAQIALDANPKSAAACAQLAALCQLAGDRTRAIELAKSAHSAAPDDPSITHLLGNLEFEAGEYRWATSLLHEAADKLADDSTVQFDLARATYSVGAVEESRAAMERVLGLAPSSAQVAEAKRFLRFVGDATATGQRAPVAELDAVLKEDPQYVPALMTRGRLAEGREDWLMAARSYEAALQRYPDFLPAQKALTLAYAHTGGTDQKAAAVATKARQAYPSDPELAKAFGLIVYRQGDYSRAVTLLRESAAARPSDSELLYYLGMSQYELKQTAESKRALQRALELGLSDELAAQARKSLTKLD